MQKVSVGNAVKRGIDGEKEEENVGDVAEATAIGQQCNQGLRSDVKTI